MSKLPRPHKHRDRLIAAGPPHAPVFAALGRLVIFSAGAEAVGLATLGRAGSGWNVSTWISSSALRACSVIDDRCGAGSDRTFDFGSGGFLAFIWYIRRDPAIRHGSNSIASPLRCARENILPAKQPSAVVFSAFIGSVQDRRVAPGGRLQGHDRALAVIDERRSVSKLNVVNSY